MSASQDQVTTQLRTLQVIHGAMAAGVIFAIGILTFVRYQQGKSLVTADHLTPLLLVALGLFAVNVPLSFWFPAVVLHAQLSRIAAGTWQPPQSPGGPPRTGPWTDEAKLMAGRLTAHIIGLALLEGSAFLSCIVVFLEGQALALALAGAALLLILARFPTEGRIRAWLSEQTDRLAQLRRENPPPGLGLK
jgi:hypothetical protein